MKLNKTKVQLREIPDELKKKKTKRTKATC